MYAPISRAQRSPGWVRAASDPDLPWIQAAIAKFTEATGITVNLVNGENETTARLQAMRQQFAAQSSDIDAYQIDIIWPGVVAEHAVPLQDQLERAGRHDVPRNRGREYGRW